MLSISPVSAALPRAATTNKKAITKKGQMRESRWPLGSERLLMSLA